MNYMIESSERTARATVRDAPVSTKQAIELCAFLRGKSLDRAIGLCQAVIAKREAVPFTRFTNGLGHKPGRMASGRYPTKAASTMLALLQSVQANAQNEGLTGTLKITHLACNRASRPMRNRLKYRGEFKRTHLEVQVTEVAEKKTPAKKASKEEKPAAAETKPEAPVKEQAGASGKSPVKEGSAEVRKEDTQDVPAAQEERAKPDAPESTQDTPAKPATPAAKPEEAPVQQEAEKREERKPAEPSAEKQAKEEKDGN